MEYKCRIKAKEKYVTPSYSRYVMTLYYRKGITLVSKKHTLCSMDNRCVFVEDLKTLNSMSEDDFINFVKNIIIKEEGEKLKSRSETNEFYSEMSKLNKKGKFTIKI